MLHHLPPSLRLPAANLIRFVRGREPIVLIAVLAMVLSCWAFIWVADEVGEGSTGNFDRWAIVHLRQAHDPSLPIGPRWLAEAGRDVTGLGGVVVLTLYIFVSAGFLAVYRAFRTMTILILSTSSGIAISLLLKAMFGRPRPSVVPHLAEVYTSSFPSGHAMMSAVVYLTIAAIIAPILKRFWLRFYVLAVAISLTAMIGLSRVYMGVHYPTDVLAGWAAGATWAITCWLVSRVFFVPRIDPVETPQSIRSGVQQR